MVSEKVSNKEATQSRVFLASRVLTGKVRSKVSKRPLEEPWRSQRANGQHPNR
jgi:hypothetical protein